MKVIPLSIEVQQGWAWIASMANVIFFHCLALHRSEEIEPEVGHYQPIPNLESVSGQRPVYLPQAPQSNSTLEYFERSFYFLSVEVEI